MAIDGLNISGESQLTYEITTLRKLLDSQEQVIAKYIVEEEHELKKESQTTSNQEDTRPEEIKKRFIISEDGQTIYDNKTKLTWERDWTKRAVMNWDDAMKINDNNFKIPSRDNFKSLNILNINNYPLFEDLEKMGFILGKNNSWYWTSEKEDMVTAWIVSFYNGNFYAEGKTSAYYVVCVKQN